MKNFIYIALIAAFSGALNVQASETFKVDECEISGPRLEGVQVICRIIQETKNIYLIFQGPHLRIGDDVTVSIYDANTGALLQQEFMVGSGGGQYEGFSIEDLESGSYFMDVEGGIYNGEFEFVL